MVPSRASTNAPLTGAPSLLRVIVPETVPVVLTLNVTRCSLVLQQSRLQGLCLAPAGTVVATILVSAPTVGVARFRPLNWMGLFPGRAEFPLNLTAVPIAFPCSGESVGDRRRDAGSGTTSESNYH